MTIPDDKGSSSAAHRASPWIAFRHTTFTVVWIATVVANVGTWMNNAASGWLMTTLDADPLTVSLVQVANSLPMFLFALPAGALADTVDKRRFLIGTEIVLAIVAAASAMLVWLNLVTPSILLLFTFLLGAGAAFTAPAWQSVVPQLVPKQDLAAAVASNGVGVNISRAIGPALGGVVIGGLGIAAPFWINALSTFAVIGALLWWRPPSPRASGLPPERLTGAAVIGFRHVRYNPNLRATLIRAVAFYFFASAYWALLPLGAGRVCTACAPRGQEKSCYSRCEQGGPNGLDRSALPTAGRHRPATKTSSIEVESLRVFFTPRRSAVSYIRD
jgi:MFS family permease